MIQTQKRKIPNPVTRNPLKYACTPDLQRRATSTTGKEAFPHRLEVSHSGTLVVGEEVVGAADTTMHVRVCI